MMGGAKRVVVIDMWKITKGRWVGGHVLDDDPKCQSDPSKDVRKGYVVSRRRDKSLLLQLKRPNAPQHVGRYVTTPAFLFAA